MDKYKLIFNEEEPKYIQLKSHIKNLIDNNEIKDGEKLPSIRALSNFLGVNKVTVINGYKKLQEEGYATQIMGSGTYGKKKEVYKGFRKRYSNEIKKIFNSGFKGIIDFSGETALSSFFPVNELKKVLNEVLDRDGSKALVYQEALGYYKLRQAINDKFWGNKQKEDNILIVSGAQQGIDIASKALININDNVIIEKPTYSGALSVFKWRRANVFEVNMESDGVDINSFEKILKKHRIKCFYAMSYFQNPTGISYSLEKKKRILDLAEKYDFYIIEDDYLSELIYDKSIEYITFKELDEFDRVIYIKSFSKIFLPGIRLGYIICPEVFLESFQNFKVNTDIATSSLMQRALEKYIENGFWQEYIKYLNLEYRKRYLFIKNILDEDFKDVITYNDPKGGLNFFLNINSNINITSLELFDILKERKILITPGVLFYKNSECGYKNFRIGFSETEKEDIKKGMDIIKNILIERGDNR
ncbi:PLP-dependent aminotransferase family protein [Clostridium fallax]|uniref:Transcriptional regulator, GntR family n=1 Tax=Clostridium fallax TaxID=1533 RepID=A0A1M4UAD4_9CLOT|nr:PLP-dependent aminotransferase family protein [Clostridium fallax]SHE53742.1 transcriptional regulator, GntR family [Clostridium fallax]SQB06161.1 GntR family transcriptional regulator [Clostridium fallax]